MISQTLCEDCLAIIRLYILRQDQQGFWIDDGDGHPYWAGGGEWDYEEPHLCTGGRNG